MSNSIVVVGNLTRDVELRFTQSGTAVASFSIASNRRKKVGDEWEDAVSFFNVTAWGSLAENVASSLNKGDRVVAQGYMEQRSYETNDGEKRTVFDMTANDVGAELRYATVAVERVRRTEGGGQRTMDEAAAEPF